MRFSVDVPGHRGSLEQLVARAQRGEVDLARVPVSAVTSQYRERIAARPELDPQELADFLGHAARLVERKAALLIPDVGLDLGAVEVGADPSPVDNPGARLAEYRLFRAAAAALAGATGDGLRSFLATPGSSAAAATESLTIPEERLVGALREVLARLPDASAATALAAPVIAAVTVSVEERCAVLRALVAERGTVPFDELFTDATTREEVIAVFLALLELIRRGEILVEVSDAESGALVLYAAAAAAHGAEPLSPASPADDGAEAPA